MTAARSSARKRGGADMGRCRYVIEPGTVIGRWTVLRHGTTDNHGQYSYLCRCECGTEKWVRSHALRTGRSLSCGCYRNELKSAWIAAGGMKQKKEKPAAKQPETPKAVRPMQIPRPYIPKDISQFGYDQWMFSY